MVIYISDSGITKSDSAYPTDNAIPVKGISPVRKTDRDTNSVVREVEKAYVAETTPAYTVSLSSMGKAAVKSLKSLTESMNNKLISADNTITTNLNTKSTTDNKKVNDANNVEAAIYQTSVDMNRSEGIAKDTGTFAGQVEEPEPLQEPETESSSSVNTNNLSRYTDYQLQQMLDDGTITRSEYNTEIEKRSGQNTAQNQDPIMKQAVAAYNFQMAYQINAAMIQ